MQCEQRAVCGQRRRMLAIDAQQVALEAQAVGVARVRGQRPPQQRGRRRRLVFGEGDARQAKQRVREDVVFLQRLVEQGARFGALVEPEQGVAAQGEDGGPAGAFGHAVELVEQALVLALQQQALAQQDEQVGGRCSQGERAAQFLFGRHGVGLVDIHLAKQAASIAVVGILLQGIFQLDDGGVDVAALPVLARLRDQRARFGAALAAAQRDARRQCQCDAAIVPARRPGWPDHAVLLKCGGMCVTDRVGKRGLRKLRNINKSESGRKRGDVARGLRAWFCAPAAPARRRDNRPCAAIPGGATPARHTPLPVRPASGRARARRAGNRGAVLGCRRRRP